MPSLGDAYERRAGTASRRQVVLGTGLFATGALLVAGGILAGATGLLVGNGFTVLESREIGAILAGLGLPAVFVGVTIVLPARRVHRAATVLGSGLAVLGVMLFRYAYPDRWYAQPGIPASLTLWLLVVYVLGVLVTVWALFTAVATFKTRNDPGGTVSLSVETGGAAATVEAAREDFHAAKSALGSVGVFGGVDEKEPLYFDSGGGALDPSASDGGTDANADISSPMDDGQTADVASPDAADSSRTARSTRAPDAARTGSSTQTNAQKRDRPATARQDEGAEFLDGPRPGHVEPDRYCGNCTHFDYGRDADSMQPYCGLHEESMDDMEACEWWETNSGP